MNVWEVITAISAAVQAIAVVVAIIYAGRELRSAANDRHLDVIFKLYEAFNAPQARAARYHIFNDLPSKPGSLSREDYVVARDTWNLMDQIGIVAHHNLASRELILELYSLQVVRLWNRLEPHILYYRAQRGNFAVYFEELAKLSREYRKKRFGENEAKIYRGKPAPSSTGELPPEDE